MASFIKRQKTSSIVWNSIMIIMGILLCALKGDALFVLERIMATFLIIYGAFNLVIFCITPIYLRDGDVLIDSIVILVFGIILDFFPTLFILGVGLILLLEGLRELAYAIDLKKIGGENWLFDLISGSTVFGLGLAVVILCNTSVGSNIVSLLLGITLIIDSSLEIIMISTLKRDFTSVRKFVKETDDGFTDYSIK